MVNKFQSSRPHGKYSRPDIKSEQAGGWGRSRIYVGMAGLIKFYYYSTFQNRGLETVEFDVI